MRPIHMLWLKRYCLAPCFYFTALRQWRQLQLPYFVHCRLQFDKFSSFVVLFPSSNSTHIAQLRAWMQPVFDKHQIKIKSIQLCQTTDLPCPVAVKTISALSFLGPQMRYVFPSNKELSVTLVSNHFISEQAFLFIFQPILLTHAAQKPRKPLHSLLGLALQPPCQLSGEKDIGQLAVTVGEATIVALLTIEVMEADSASMMSQWGHVHNAGWCRLLQALQ